MERYQAVKQLGGYKIVCQLGKGSFGTVYKAIKVKEQEKQEESKFYAIKVQNIGTVKPMLHLQSDILKSLKKRRLVQSQNHKGFAIPQIFFYHQEEYFSYMVMELLGTTLEDFANKEMKNILSKDCLIRIFYSILKIIESLHQLGYIHRDIKPSNFMLKLKKDINETTSVNQKYQSQIFPIDLGLCKSYINPLTRQHIPLKQNKKMVGTAIFCSLNTHQGFQQSRRDDLQSIVYLVTYLVKKLPWESVSQKEINRGQQIKNELESPRKLVNIKSKLDIYDQIYLIKKSTDFDTFLKDPLLLPSCLLQIYKYIRKISFEQEPNYQYIISLLQKQHLQLTGQKLSLTNYECRWEDLCLKQDNKVKQQPNEKKKIKINFKIPANKLKKPQSQQVSKNQQMPSSAT